MEQFLSLENLDNLDEVNSWNSTTVDRCMANEVYHRAESDALALLEAKDKLPHCVIRGPFLYNFWQDSAHRRGLLRRAKVSDFVLMNGAVEWEVLVDIDELRAAEDFDVVWKGSTNLFSSITGDSVRGLLSLSDGGQDKVILREFDYESGQFVAKEEGAFQFAESRHGVVWLDRDNLLVGTRWNDDDASLTSSLYPRIIKRVSRNGGVSDTALFSGSTSDIGVWPTRLNGMHTASSGSHGDEPSFVVLLIQALDFHQSDVHFVEWRGANTFAVDSAKPIRLPLPKKADICCYFKGELVLELKEDWQGHKSGSVVSLSLSAFLLDGSVKTQLLMAQPAHGCVQSISACRDCVLVTSLVKCKGTLLFFDFAAGTWTEQSAFQVQLEQINAKGGTMSVMSVSSFSSQILFSFEEVLTPPTIYFFDMAVAAAPRPVMSLPARFDSESFKTEEFETASIRDGFPTRYIVTRPKKNAESTPPPLVLSVYGGFQVVYPRSYAEVNGKLLLENGFALGLATVRGGGEEGPDYHQAALKDKRVSLDDLVSCARDIVKRGITTADRIILSGGSHGGFMVAASSLLYPLDYGGALCRCPLLDFKRYHLLGPGASWIAEYGDPDNAEDLEKILSFSPMHLLETMSAAKSIPPIFFLLSTKDDRVHPGHARRFQKLLHSKFPDRETWYYECTSGGHSVSADLKEKAKRLALESAFLSQFK